MTVCLYTLTDMLIEISIISSIITLFQSPSLSKPELGSWIPKHGDLLPWPLSVLPEPKNQRIGVFGDSLAGQHISPHLPWTQLLILRRHQESNQSILCEVWMGLDILSTLHVSSLLLSGHQGLQKIVSSILASNNYLISNPSKQCLAHYNSIRID